MNILTGTNQEQSTILSAFAADPFLTNQFYFTGGTSLQTAYYQHRLSEDLDFFSYQEFDPELIPTIFNEVIQVDSLTDIAVNKIVCINQRTEIKDFVDLYFLLKQFSIWDLFEGVKHKFNIKMEPYIFASDVMVVEDFTTLPRMIKPLTLSELQQFYIDLARKLGGMVMEE